MQALHSVGSCLMRGLSSKIKKNALFYKKNLQKFWWLKKKLYLCTRQTTTTQNNGLVAQLNRASDSGSEGYRFESCRDHKGTQMSSFFCCYTTLPTCSQRRGGQDFAGDPKKKTIAP